MRGHGRPLKKINCKDIKAAGYDGIDVPLPTAQHEGEFKFLLREYDLRYIAFVQTVCPDHHGSFAEVTRVAELRPNHLAQHKRLQ
ncbi:MAG: hypothetical protein H0T92_19825 [Pyrinomonadaceae bacterium]|nr:hypothetical protein [Pyrinomonadaceae bacterium]